MGKTVEGKVRKEALELATEAELKIMDMNYLG